MIHIDTMEEMLKQRYDSSLLEVPQDVIVGYLVGYYCPDQARQVWELIKKWCDILDHDEEIILSN